MDADNEKLVQGYVDKVLCNDTTMHEVFREAISRTQEATRREKVDAFVAGAKWWEYTKDGATMWQTDQREAKRAALEMYPEAPTKPSLKAALDAGKEEK